MADLAQIEDAARTLLHAEGFGHVPFKFERTTRRFGMVLVDTDTGDGIVMTMSRPFAVVNTYERCLDNIRHEIAHLITWDEDDHHGPRWRAEAIRLGLALPLSHVSEHNTVIPWFFHRFTTRDFTKTQVKALDFAA